MAEHRYPRRWSSKSGNNTYFEQLHEGGKMRYFNSSGYFDEDCFPATPEELMAGGRQELFDHHKPEPCEVEAKLSRRCVIALLKNLVREQRLEIESLKKELGRA